MTTPNLEIAVDAAFHYSEEVKRMVSELDLQHDEEKLILWANLFGYLASTSAKEIGVESTVNILHYMISRAQTGKIKTDFH